MTNDRMSFLPGDPSRRELVERILRVDHAGEHGAVRIYEGQLAVLGDTPAGAAIRRMAEQEQKHRQGPQPSHGPARGHATQRRFRLAQAQQRLLSPRESFDPHRILSSR